MYITTKTELDFKSEYLFRTCSVATNLVTSLEFNHIRCATMLCHFDQGQNNSVATHFISSSSTATSSAFSEYIAVPERFGQNEEPASSNEKRTGKKSSFVPKSVFNRSSKIKCKFLRCNECFSFTIFLNFVLYNNIFLL